MEARPLHVFGVRALGTTMFVVTLFLQAVPSVFAIGSGYRTTNFVVSAPTRQLAKEIGDTAERWRRDLSIQWLGEEMPSWTKPCPIKARVAPNMGAGGATSFVFDQGEVFGWRMDIQGSRERILDSVLPHEVTHTIFASYFRKPLPRWADEGACTTVEHPSEIAKQERMLIDFLKNGRGIPFGQMFAMKEYPRDVMPLYSQGHSLAQLLIESRGRKAFLDFLGDGMEDENWPRAIREHYGFSDLRVLQDSWLDWVRQGRPRITPATTAIAGQPAPAIFRGQSPDDFVKGEADSVYAVAASQPKRPPAARRESVYDSSRPRKVLRR